MAPPAMAPPFCSDHTPRKDPPTSKANRAPLNTVRRGRRFEALAEAFPFLHERGWRVLERNVRFLRKEIDLVVKKDGIVVFVEAKGRSGPAFGHPLDAITRRKRQAISVAARGWIRRSDFRARSYRFDSVSVGLMPDGSFDVEHGEGAWTE
ncbi:MAG TPA: YraN family protein [Gemmatimonadetes bacterium]|nr:YraN family protein [Gemmatimonadota bacterium]